MSGAGNDAVLMAGLLGGAPLLVVTAVARVHCRPRDPAVGPATMELGPEPPAIVDLLTDRFEVTSQAPVATLIDLAARRWIDIDEPVPDQVIVRLRANPWRGELASFERRVLQRVQSVAGEGPAPAGALTRGTGPEAAAWQRQFRNEVVAVARSMGLCRARWSPTVLAVPFIAGALGLAALVLGGPGDEGASAAFDRTSALTLACILLAIVGFGVGTSMAKRRAVRGTEAGLDRASAWLGFRRFLADHGRFEEYPAASVRIWDRYLGHAVALDLASLATAQLPIGAESDRSAWSRHGGRWRLVRVRYPKLRPGWGRPPWLAIPIGLAITVAGWWVGTRLGSALVDLALELPRSSLGQPWEPWVSRLARAVALVAVALWLAAGPLQALAGVLDLATMGDLVGVVLRFRVAKSDDEGRPEAFWVAVDNGSGERIRAYRVSASTAAGVTQGAAVALRVTRLLGWVQRIDLQPSGVDASSWMAPTATPAAEPAQAADPLVQQLLLRARQMQAERDRGQPPRPGDGFR